jgi:hypothetical protein
MRGRWMVLVSSGALSVLVGACAKPSEKLPGDERVLARVGDSKITQYDVQASIERTFGAEQGRQLGADVQKSVLDSLVLSRAIAQARLAELDRPELLALQRKVDVYRDELLVKEYLAKHHPSEQVSDTQAERYYREHPDRFGASDTKRFELVGSDRELSASEREVALKALAEADSEKDWANWTKGLRAKGLPFAFSSGRGNEGVLHAQLTGAVDALRVGEVSPVIFVQGRAYVARVVGADPVAPVPFERVKAQIREALAPRQVKGSLEAAGKVVLPRAHVAYEP